MEPSLAVQEGCTYNWLAHCHLSSARYCGGLVQAIIAAYVMDGYMTRSTMAVQRFQDEEEQDELHLSWLGECMGPATSTAVPARTSKGRGN